MMDPVQTARRYSPLKQLVVARLKEFLREPEAVFWVYGFPILMIVALGIAFRSKPVERITVDVQAGPVAEQLREQLATQTTSGSLVFVVQIHDAETAHRRLRTGKTDLVVVAEQGMVDRAFQYHLDTARAESRLARSAVQEVLQVAAGRSDPVATRPDVELTEPGSRYIDFLVPGLLGISLMGGGLWGVGFVIVDMRIRKLLKRFLATPMKRSDFLFGIMLSRMLFMIPEVVIMLLVAWLAFGVVIQGSVAAVLLLVIVGSLMFCGIGLLVASRAKTVETVTGLMNLVMLPMWLLSGVFFSPERFPDLAQPVIRALPLTALINALRAVMLEGLPLASQWSELAIISAYAVVTFALALRIFRWR